MIQAVKDVLSRAPLNDGGTALVAWCLALGNNVTLTNALVASSNNGTFAVAGGAGNDTMDASGISNGIPISFFSNGGSDTFKGGNRNDGFVVAAADLASATIVGGTGVDNLYLSTGGTDAAAFTNVSAIEGLVLSAGQ